MVHNIDFYSFVSPSHLFSQPAVVCTTHPVTSYTIELSSLSSPNPVSLMKQPLDSDSRISVTINSSNGLLENTLYSYRVIAINDVGSSISESKELCELCILCVWLIN